ncbi:MAG: undecaprenyl-diphosphate phosphatase [Thermodesulfobacteriota bacterium]
MLEAIILGLIQGLTEFLPVSSSGHLVLGQALLGLKEPEIFFDVILHLGTLAAVIILMRRELSDLILEFFRLPRHLKSRSAAAAAWRERPSFRLLWLVFFGSIPTGLLGLGFKSLFEAMFASTLAVGVGLCLTGVVLAVTGWAKTQGRGLTRFRILDALAIGLAQGLAITPGLSRSGMTISSGLFLGLDRELAARYSFLMSIPAILGAAAVHLTQVKFSFFNPVEMAAGFIASMITGLLALGILLFIVKRGRLHWFAPYCWLIGLTTIYLCLR